DDHNVITAILKHPVPGLPNIRIQNTDLDTNANGTLTATLEVDGTLFSASEDIATDLDLSHTDITFFYSPINNWVQFDMGLTGRYFNGEVVVVGNVAGTESIDLDNWIPMFYFGTRFELPFSGLYLDANLNAIGFSGNKLSDFSAALGYVADMAGFAGLTLAGLSAELGYRAFTLEIDDINDFEGNIDIDGFYMKVGIQF
ncbi:MAG: TIGR04219 family outer membrane beta-barrel protein, partial [Pseudomonadota bacterium]